MPTVQAAASEEHGAREAPKVWSWPWRVVPRGVAHECLKAYRKDSIYSLKQAEIQECQRNGRGQEYARWRSDNWSPETESMSTSQDRHLAPYVEDSLHERV